MAPEPKRVQHTRAWLVPALRDLQGAEAALSFQPTLPDVAVFHCAHWSGSGQQSCQPNLAYALADLELRAVYRGEASRSIQRP